MDNTKKSAGVLRLEKLAADLKRGYVKAGERIGETLASLSTLIAELDEPWRPEHYAEGLRSQKSDAVRRPPGCFAHETFVNGDEADYLLCVARGPDRKCGLYVSACRYHIRYRPAEKAGGNEPPVATIKNLQLVSPDSLPVPLRVKILDVLDDFAEAYEKRLREVTDNLLRASSANTVTELEMTGAKVPRGEPKERPADGNVPVEEWTLSKR